MSTADLTQHRAPKRGPTPLQNFFTLFGGPLAWFIQLNAGFALASQPCFLRGERTVMPHWSPDWTFSGMIAVTVIACLIALLAALISWRALGGSGGRTRFLARWGLVLGIGSAVASALTTVGFFLLPRCAG
jgi:hypothetical protein